MSIYHCKSNGRMNIVLDNFKHVYINKKKLGWGEKHLQRQGMTKIKMISQGSIREHQIKNSKDNT